MLSDRRTPGEPHSVTEPESRRPQWNDADYPLDMSWPKIKFRDGGDPRRPFSPVRYWFPGALLAGGIGAVGFVLALLDYSFGWAFLSAPVPFGAFFGYGLPGRRAIAASLSITVFAALVMTMPSLLVGVASGVDLLPGLFCVVVLVALTAPLSLLGVGLGVLFRSIMRGTDLYHTRYLPLLLAALLLGPGVALESWLTPPAPPAVVATSVLIDAPLREVWEARAFADAESASPSMLAHVGLPSPEQNVGDLTEVGDIKTIPIGDGVVRLRVTESDAPRRLAFVVTEQQGFENRSVRLLGGELRLRSLGSRRTVVTLTTCYQPLLGARAVWGSIERFLAKELQLHVMREIGRAVGDSDPESVAEPEQVEDLDDAEDLDDSDRADDGSDALHQ